MEAVRTSGLSFCENQYEAGGSMRPGEISTERTCSSPLTKKTTCTACGAPQEHSRPDGRGGEIGGPLRGAVAVSTPWLGVSVGWGRGGCLLGVGHVALDEVARRRLVQMARFEAGGDLDLDGCVGEEGVDEDVDDGVVER